MKLKDLSHLITRLNKGENVTTETLLSTCQYLKFGIDEICEVTKEK